MLLKATAYAGDIRPPTPQEGTLYKELTVYGRRFPIYYGYYEQCDRDDPAVDPMPIYPNFARDPLFTDDGLPFVTKMQDACPHYCGRVGRHAECGDCSHYRHGDELLGVCTCPKNCKIPQGIKKEDSHYD